jgi:adenylate cyclase
LKQDGSTFAVSSAGLRWPGAVALLVVLLAQIMGIPALTQAGMLIFDSYLRSEPRPYEPAPVKVVDIDEESIRRYGQWPWPRTEFALLIRKLGEAGASVIALDIVFSEPDRTSPARIAEHLRRLDGESAAVSALAGLPDNDAQLARTMAEYPVVNGFFLTNDPLRQRARPKAGFAFSGTAPEDGVPNYRNAILPLSALDEAATGGGTLTLSGDRDGIVRKAPLVLRQGEQFLPALSLEALRVAQGAGAVMVKTSDGSGTLGGAGRSTEIVSIKVGAFEVPTTPAGELWLHYTRPHSERTVPAWQVLSDALSPDQLAELFAGRIVFVGAGATGLRDLVSTPIADRELGVMVHAQAAEQMILGKFLSRPDWAPGLERALILVLGLVLLALLPRLGAVKGAALGLVLAAAALGGSWYAFHGYRFLIDPTYPILAILAVYLTQTVLTYYREERRRSYIHQAFDRYLSPELVKRIASDPRQLELGGEERQMTVLFCDVRNFSRISEQMEPQAIIRFLIALLTPMCDILLARRATIDKFIGDAILAFWNAPLDDPQQYENAARSALEMVARLDRLNAEMAAQSDQPWPDQVKIGIGLNAGPCCVGNMGSAQRLSYSLIGDTVNLASRIEGLTKYYGVQIALGSALQREIPNFATLPLDLVRVVGRAAPEEISVLVGDDQVSADPAFQQFSASHRAMIAAYRAMDWDTALAQLDAGAKGARDFGLERVHTLYRERIVGLRQTPPDTTWDGVFTATEK